TVALPDGAPRAFVLPEGPLRDQLGCVVLGRRLRPILVSEVHRVLRDLVRSQDGKAVGEPVAELALDTATLHAPDGQVLVPTYYEVEVERRAGGEAPDLNAISGLLQTRFGLVRSPASKFERGLAKLAPTLHAAPTAAVDGADPVATALRKIVALQLR